MIPSHSQWREALAARHGEALQEKFDSATVAVCGLGGLGSNIAISLARAGVGTLRLIDFDKVDITNMHRQQYKAHQIGTDKTLALAENLAEIAPYVTIETITARLDDNNLATILAGADIVCEACDGAETKALLVNGVLEHLPETYLVAASGMAGIDTPNTIRTRRITPRFYLCGDEVSEVSQASALLAPQVMLCAAHQAHTVLRILSGNFDV